jgi:general secretion pathway protein G
MNKTFRVIKYTLVFFSLLFTTLLYFGTKQLHTTPDFKMARTITAIKSISTMLQLFKAENSFYPENLEVLADPNAETRVYIKKKERLIDPWGKPYIYLNPDKYGEVYIYSLGPDGIPSQDDIGNWQVEND